MAICQVFNKKINAWVKLKENSKGYRIMNVKQKKPTVKFKGVPVRKKKK